VRQCTAKTKNGERCKNAALKGQQQCFVHSPVTAKARAEARRRGGLNRRTPKADPQAARPASLRTVADVLALLEETLADTRLQENSAQRSRTMISLALAALKAFEVGELEERVEALEAVAYGRKEGNDSADENKDREA